MVRDKRAALEGLLWSDTYFLDVIAWVSYAAILMFGFLKPITLPVRFHKKNQEVYVWHKEVLYRIPWEECELSVIAAQTHIGFGQLKDGYELMLWLNPKHAVNKDLSGERHRYIKMVHNTGSHVCVYAYWEYVRRYMMGETPLHTPIDKEPRVAGVNYELAREEGRSRLSAIIDFIIGLPILFLVRPEFFAIWATPLRDK